MPNIASAAKRMRSDARKRAKNQAVLSKLKSLSKKLAQQASNPEKASVTAQELVSCYDRAVTCGTIPRGRADRRKSRIAQFLAKIKKKK